MKYDEMTDEQKREFVALEIYASIEDLVPTMEQLEKDSLEKLTDRVLKMFARAADRYGELGVEMDANNYPDISLIVANALYADHIDTYEAVHPCSILGVSALCFARAAMAIELLSIFGGFMRNDEVYGHGAAQVLRLSEMLKSKI
jgi:hypothetical protein